MKKSLLVLLILLLLCGCSAPEAAPFATEDAEMLLASGAFEGSDMAPLEPELLLMLYGVEAENVTDCVGYLAANTWVSADELAIFVLRDADAALAAEEACRTRLSAQLAMCRDYCPEAVPRLTDACVERRENTVLLAVGDPKLLAAALERP